MFRANRGVRGAIAAAVSAVLVVGAVSCQPHPYTSSAQKGTYLMGEVITPSQMANINPFQLTGNWAPLLRYVYDSLFYFNQVSGKLTPDLATSGTWSADFLHYRVDLAHATWQDGRPVTGNDVVYTINVLKKYPQADRYGLWQHLSSVSANGDSVTFTMKTPFEGLPYLLSQIYIVPQHIWQKQQNPLTEPNTHPVGSGPYRYRSYQNGVAINLERNSSYFAGAPKIKHLVISVYSNSTSLTLALQKGSVNTTTGTIAMPSLPILLKTKTNRLQKFGGLSVYSVLENNTKAGLDNVLVRRAIQRAINQKALIEQGELNGVVRQNPGWLPSIFTGYVNESVYDNPKYSYNPAAARALLKRAGYHINGSGVAEKNGKTLSYDYYEPSGAPAQEKEASMIRGWLKAIGIKTRAKLVTGPEMAKIAADGTYDLMQYGTAVPPDPVQSLDAPFDSRNTAPAGKTAPGLNYTRFRDPQLDTTLRQAATTLDTAKLRQLLDKAQQIIADAAPVAVMYNVGGHLLYRTDLYTGYNTKYPIYAPPSLDEVHSR